MAKKKQIEYKKIFARAKVYDLERLDKIRKQYGFKSNYQILQYLLHCFLRVADPENDLIDEPVPEEISDMFTNFTEFEDTFYEKQRPDSIKRE